MFFHVPLHALSRLVGDTFGMACDSCFDEKHLDIINIYGICNGRALIS